MKLPKTSVFLLIVAGCGGGASDLLDRFEQAELDPNDLEAVRDAAELSAPNMFFQALLPMFLTSTSQDTSCPKRTSNGIEGGCVDANGNEWIGSISGATVGSMSPPPNATIRFDGFGMVTTSTCPGASGKTEVTFDGSVAFGSGGEFEADLIITGSGLDDDCEPRAAEVGLEYRGTMIDEGDREIWSGSGRIGSEAGGVFSATTENEVTDDTICSSEAASGRTTVQTKNGDAVFTYDGATDCDQEGTVTWTFAGAEKGELSGVQCTGVCMAGQGSAWILLLGLLLQAGLRRWTDRIFHRKARRPGSRYIQYIFLLI